MRSIERLLEKARQFHKDGKGQGLCLVYPTGGGQWEAATTIQRHGKYETETATFDRRDKAILWGRSKIGDNGQMMIDDIAK